MVIKMGKPYKYYLSYGEHLDLITTDPKGWQEQSIGFNKSDDHGLNVETTISLSFSGNAYTTLKSIYEANYGFSEVFLIIKKRQQDWTYSNFYTYKLDFSNYVENVKNKCIEISGIDSGLLTLLSNYKDTEYEITLPTNKTYALYTGIELLTNNLIQCSYGSIKDKGKINLSDTENVYLFKGKHSVINESDILSFVDNNEYPFETMTFRCIKSGTFSMAISLKMLVICNGTLFNPSTGNVKLISHSSDYSNPITLYTFTPNPSTVHASRRRDTFNQERLDIEITINSGRYLSLVYCTPKTKNELPYDDITVYNAEDTYIDMYSTYKSPYIKAKIECFTYKQIIELLLAKIDSNATLNYNLVDQNFTPVISCTQCIKNVGLTDGTGIIKISLSDVLKSLNCLYCIGIDITGEVMTIDLREKFYLNTKYKTIKCKDILLKHDPSHQYNKITVGYDVDSDVDNSEKIIYPFNCEKVFEVSGSVSENELDIKNPFKSDPYDIEQLFIDTLTSQDNTTDSDIFILCCKSGYVNDVSGMTGYASYENKSVSSWTGFTGYVTGEFASGILDVLLTATNWEPEFEIGKVARYYVEENGNIKLYISINIIHQLGDDFRLTIKKNGLILDLSSATINVESKGDSEYERELEIQFDCVQGDYIDFYFEALTNGESDFYTNGFELQVTNYTSNVKELDKRQTDDVVTNFEGEYDTMFNIPITPKRILKQHLKYLSLSTLGSSKNIEYVSTDINSSISSKMLYETSAVEENSDETPVTPMFLPMTAECEAISVYDNDFLNHKYEYIEFINEKNGKVYQGWINSITFAPIKNKSDKIIFQLKSK